MQIVVVFVYMVQTVFDYLIINLGFDFKLDLLQIAFQFFLANLFKKPLVVLQSTQMSIFDIDLSLENLPSVRLLIRVNGAFVVDSLESILIYVFNRGVLSRNTQLSVLPLILPYISTRHNQTLVLENHWFQNLTAIAVLSKHYKY